MHKYYDEEVSKYARIREENMNLKLHNANELSDYKNTLRAKEIELEELKHQHFVVTQERLNGLSNEKNELRDTFEESIRKLRHAHEQDTGERQARIKDQKSLSFS